MKPVTRQLALLLSGLAILAGINATVWRYEHAMSSGEVVLLRLAPVDPRSLMQGDYMRLNYPRADQPRCPCDSKQGQRYPGDPPRCPSGSHSGGRWQTGSTRQR